MRRLIFLQFVSQGDVFLLQFHELKLVYVDGVEQIGTQRRVVGVKFFFDKQIERGRMNLRVSCRKLSAIIKTFLAEKIQYGIAIFGVLAKEIKFLHDTIENIATILE